MTQDHGVEHQDQVDLPPLVPGILAIADCADGGPDVQRLLDVAAEYLVGMGVDVSILDLNDLQLPEFFEIDGSLGIPAGVLGLRQLLCAHDGFLIALPYAGEGTRSILMNAIEWSLSAALGERAKGAYTGKCAALMSVVRRDADAVDPFFAARDTLSNLDVTVIPEELSLVSGTDCFVGGRISDRETEIQLARQMEGLVGMIGWMRNIPRLT